MALPATGLIALGTAGWAPLVDPFLPWEFKSLVSTFPTAADFLAASVLAACAGLALETLLALAGLALETGFFDFEDLDLLRVTSRGGDLGFELGWRLDCWERFGFLLETAFLVGLGIPEWSGRFDPTSPSQPASERW